MGCWVCVPARMRTDKCGPARSIPSPAIRKWAIVRWPLWPPFPRAVSWGSVYLHFALLCIRRRCPTKSKQATVYSHKVARSVDLSVHSSSSSSGSHYSPAIAAFKWPVRVCPTCASRLQMIDNLRDEILIVNSICQPIAVLIVYTCAAINIKIN